MKNDSTPSKGWDWENELLKKLRRNVDLDLDWIFPYIHKVIYEVKQEERNRIQEDIKSVLNLLDGNTPREKIANYIREYLEEE
jgi:hypothetical protein